MRRRLRLACVLFAVAVGLVFGCGENATLFNPSFINFAVGGIVPVVPGRTSGFVLVRVINSTSAPAANIRFVVTAERQTEVTDEAGATTVTVENETVRLQTFPVSQANEVGVLFDCPVARVGLGERIDFPATEPGLFIGAEVGGVEGFGVPSFVNPLSVSGGNFECGDTLIYQASSQSGNVGNLSVTTFVLDADEQPVEVAGPDTFNNARSVIEEFAFEE